MTVVKLGWWCKAKLEEVLMPLAEAFVITYNLLLVYVIATALKSETGKATKTFAELTPTLFHLSKMLIFRMPEPASLL